MTVNPSSNSLNKTEVHLWMVRNSGSVKVLPFLRYDIPEESPELQLPHLPSKQQDPRNGRRAGFLLCEGKKNRLFFFFNDVWMTRHHQIATLSSKENAEALGSACLCLNWVCYGKGGRESRQEQQHLVTAWLTAWRVLSNSNCYSWFSAPPVNARIHPRRCSLCWSFRVALNSLIHKGKRQREENLYYSLFITDQHIYCLLLSKLINCYILLGVFPFCRDEKIEV